MLPRSRVVLSSLLALCVVGMEGSARGEGVVTLGEALRGAVQGDEEILAAEQDVESARADVLKRTSRLLPTLELSGGPGKGADEAFFLWVRGETTEIDYTFWRAETLFAAPLLAPSNIGELVSSSRGLRAAEQGADAERVGVLFDVVRAYYKALSAHFAVKVARASSQAARALEIAAQKRLKAGTETTIEVERARADRIAAEGAALEASYDAQIADLGLAHLARLPQAPYTLTPPDPPRLPDENDEQRIELALTGRPDVLSQRWSYRAARAAVHAQALSLVPELQVRWSTEYSLYNPETTRSTPHEWALMLRADWELPGLLEPAADIAAARADERRSELALQRLERDIELAVRTAELAREAAGAALGVASERDIVAQANLEAGMRLYEEGMATGLEVSTLKSARDAAAAELVRAHLERDLAEVALLEVLGIDPLTAYAGP